MSKVNELAENYRLGLDSEYNIDDQCLYYENQIEDAYKEGYKNAIAKAKQWIKDNYWTCSSAEEYSKEFVKFMEE